MNIFCIAYFYEIPSLTPSHPSPWEHSSSWQHRSIAPSPKAQWGHTVLGQCSSQAYTPNCIHQERGWVWRVIQGQNLYRQNLYRQNVYGHSVYGPNVCGTKRLRDKRSTGQKVYCMGQNIYGTNRLREQNV